MLFGIWSSVFGIIGSNSVKFQNSFRELENWSHYITFGEDDPWELYLARDARSIVIRPRQATSEFATWRNHFFYLFPSAIGRVRVRVSSVRIIYIFIKNKTISSFWRAFLETKEDDLVVMILTWGGSSPCVYGNNYLRAFCCAPHQSFSEREHLSRCKARAEHRILWQCP